MLREKEKWNEFIGFVVCWWSMIYGNGDVSLCDIGNGLVSLALDGEVDLVLFPELLLFPWVLLLSAVDGLLCQLRRYSATGSWPNVSASSNGVFPQRSFGSCGTLHCSNRNSTQSKWPSLAAKCSAVRPTGENKQPTQQIWTTAWIWTILKLFDKSFYHRNRIKWYPCRIIYGDAVPSHRRWPPKTVNWQWSILSSRIDDVADLFCGSHAWDYRTDGN